MDKELKLPVTIAAARDWPEDANLENGNYANICCHCSEQFAGHKRRVVCKQCSEIDRLTAENERLRLLIQAALDPFHNTPYASPEALWSARIDKLRTARTALSEEASK